MNKLFTLFICLWIVAITGCAQTQSKPGVGVATEQKKASSGNTYTLIYKGGSLIKFSTKRPDKKDKKVLLCIAAAFTQLDNGLVDGAYAVDGKIGNTKYNHHLGGAIFLEAGACDIFPLKKLAGDSLDAEDEKKIKESKAGFFQQIQIIVDGKAEKFKDVKLFQRRAIVVMTQANKKFITAKNIAIIESLEPITLAAFSNDLVELGAYNALYTDMGAWDEGWYRDAKGEIKIIGTNKSQTAKQSNWVVFTK